MKPEKVHLNVLPENADERKEMFKQLASIQSQFDNKLNEIKVKEAETMKKFSFKRIKLMKRT